MNEPAVRVTSVSKRFRIPLDRSATLKYRVTHLRSASRYRDLLAVNDVSFDVAPASSSASPVPTAAARAPC